MGRGEREERHQHIRTFHFLEPVPFLSVARWEGVSIVYRSVLKYRQVMMGVGRRQYE